MASILKQLTINRLIISSGKKIEQKHFTDTPIIIGACPRSGTTLLLSILAASKNIFAIPNQTAAYYKWIMKKNPETGQEEIYPQRLDRLYRQFLMNKIPDAATRWLEKTPRHIQHFKNILEYYGENILLINLVRDGRDIVTSKHPKHRSDEYYLELDRWVNDVKLGLDLKDNAQVLTVCYEDLVHNFEKTMRKIYQFIKEEIPKELGDWKKNTSIKKSKHWDKPVQDIHSDSILRWQKPEHKKVIDNFMNNEEAVDLLLKLGYKL